MVVLFLSDSATQFQFRTKARFLLSPPMLYIFWWARVRPLI